MFKTLLNIFRVPELRNKVLFTLFMLVIYRIGFHVPLPGVDQQAMSQIAKNQDDTSAAGRMASYVSIFSGGSLSQSTIFGLGIMPYISSSIIFQLLGTVVPSLEKLQKEGETGRKKIQEWSRYVTVPLCIVQAVFLLSYMQTGNSGRAWCMPLFQRSICRRLLAHGPYLPHRRQHLPDVARRTDRRIRPGQRRQLRHPRRHRRPHARRHRPAGPARPTSPARPAASSQINLGKICSWSPAFVFVVAGSILITQAQRRIPIQQAKHTRGRRVYGGQQQFLPLRVNHGGVMPIIFAQSLMLFPGVVLAWVARHSSARRRAPQTSSSWLNDEFRRGSSSISSPKRR